MTSKENHQFLVGFVRQARWKLVSSKHVRPTKFGVVAPNRQIVNRETQNAQDGVAMQLACARKRFGDRFVQSGVLVRGAKGLRHTKFHRNLTTGRFKNVEFTHAPGECDFELFC
jgi:hypothetical protein